MNPYPNLSSPNVEELRISKQLMVYIQELIKKNQGSINFKEYMNACLYTPSLGYYANPKLKFGISGDFVTAPEISAVFSQCLGGFCHKLFKEWTLYSILELGAGTGKLAVDILQELELLNKLPQYYYILEVSAFLKMDQKSLIKNNIPHLFDKIIWIDTLEDFHLNGLVIANEIMDAMPVNRFVKKNDDYYEVFVSINNDQLVEVLKPVPLSAIPVSISTLLQDFPEYTFEYNALIGPWINALKNILNSGVILLIDYGFPILEYYHPERSMGTLMCHYKHHFHTDPFWFPGLQDITAHVDFTNVATSALKSGLKLLGYTNQASFLLELGILDKNLSFKDKNSLQTLLMPHEMGELFKVMALGTQEFGNLVGFQEYDKSYKLNLK
ncbi:MAG: uncharacterized protein JWM09_1092 [Francisellaceae bacterium]|nr:uncharacterized protein [Francisellaceae bacterium]